MAQCPLCSREVVSVTHGQATRLLDPVPLTYVAVDVDHTFPQDGDRVVLSGGLVEHSIVCPKQAEQRAQQRAAYQRRQKGATA